MCRQCWSSIPRSPQLFYTLEEIESAAAGGAYEGTLRDIIHVFKYEGRRSLARPLATLMREQSGALLEGVTAAVPVPLHRVRKGTRGFNQAHDLSRWIGPPVVLALRRTRPTAPQVGLTGSDRQRNVADAFAVTRRAALLESATIVLIDDVSTTGATLEACARILKGAGVREVRALTAARVVT